jgi:hypothetical protein
MRAAALLSMFLFATASVTAHADETNPYIAGDDPSPPFLQKDDGNPNGLAMTADFLIARPLGLLSTVVGGVVYVGALPFMLMSRDVQTPARRLIAEPADYTFRRPLGELGDWR